MDVRKLRILRELADRETVSAVADALSYTPSAISQHIRALQAEVGVTLTEPDGRGLRLTDAGRALAAHADDVVAAMARAEAEMDEYRRTPRGQVRVALFPSAALLLLSGLLSRMSSVPDIAVECRDVDMTPAQVRSLAADFDVVIAHRDDQAVSFDDQRLEVVHLYREPLDVALAPGHPLGRKRRVDLTELAGEQWIGVDVGFPVDDVLRSLAVRTGVRPTVVQRINDFKVTEKLVAEGHGVALLPRYTMDDRNGRRLLRRPLAGVRAGRHVEAVLRSGVSTRPTVRVLLEALRAEVAAITGPRDR